MDSDAKKAAKKILTDDLELDEGIDFPSDLTKASAQKMAAQEIKDLMDNISNTDVYKRQNLTRAEKKRQTQLITDEHSSFQSDSSDEDTEIGDSDRYPLFGTNGNSDRYPPFGSNGNGSNGNGSNAYGSNANGGNNNKDYNIKPDIKPNIINPNPNQYQEEDGRGEEYPMEFIEHNYDLDEEIVSLYQEKHVSYTHLDVYKRQLLQ